MGLTGCYTCMKYMVVIFNLILWLTGIAVLAVSIWLYLDSSVYLQNTNDNSLYFTTIFVLIAAGAVMFLIGLLGCCGALQESPCMLGSFFIFLLVVFAAELTGGVLAYLNKDKIDNIISAQVKKMVKEEYGISKSVERTIDAMQHDLSCCGADGPNDWAYSKLNSKGSSAIEVGITKSSGYYEVPATCCRVKIPQDCEYHRKVKFSGKPYDGLYNEGCVHNLQRYLRDNMLIIAGIAIGIGIIQVLGLILSMSLCCAVRSESTMTNA